MSAPGDAVNRYIVSLCDDCLCGVGGECHTPGCALWMSVAPDIAIRVEGVAPPESCHGPTAHGKPWKDVDGAVHLYTCGGEHCDGCAT